MRIASLLAAAGLLEARYLISRSSQLCARFVARALDDQADLCETAALSASEMILSISSRASSKSTVSRLEFCNSFRLFQNMTAFAFQVKRKCLQHHPCAVPIESFRNLSKASTVAAGARSDI